MVIFHSKLLVCQAGYVRINHVFPASPVAATAGHSEPAGAMGHASEMDGILCHNDRTGDTMGIYRGNI